MSKRGCCPDGPLLSFDYISLGLRESRLSLKLLSLFPGFLQACVCGLSLSSLLSGSSQASALFLSDLSPKFASSPYGHRLGFYQTCLTVKGPLPAPPWLLLCVSLQRNSPSQFVPHSPVLPGNLGKGWLFPWGDWLVLPANSRISVPLVGDAVIPWSV